MKKQNSKYDPDKTYVVTLKVEGQAHIKTEMPGTEVEDYIAEVNKKYKTEHYFMVEEKRK